jgi:hypothetical protein
VVWSDANAFRRRLLKSACCSSLSVALLALATRVAQGQEPMAVLPRPSLTPSGGAEAPHASSTIQLVPKGHFFSFSGGYSDQVLYGVGIAGVDLEAMGGTDYGKVAIAAIADCTPGSTQYGLSTFAITVGPHLEGHFGLLRVGGGLRFGVLNVERATASGSLLGSSVGTYLRLSADFARFGDNGGGLFVVAKGSADYVGEGLFGLVAGVGVRL